MSNNHAVNMVALEHARWRLGTVWFLGSGVVFILLVIQSLTGAYGERTQGVWGWALPNFLPTLMLMLGVFAGTALTDEAESDRMRVRNSFLILATGLSAFHLLCLLLTLLIQPFIPALSNGTVRDPMEIFETSNLWLGPMQGLVGGAIGALFFSKAQDKGQAANTAPNPNVTDPNA